ncbi:unnamed protein product [Calypogeia fissa]
MCLHFEAKDDRFVGEQLIRKCNVGFVDWCVLFGTLFSLLWFSESYFNFLCSEFGKVFENTGFLSVVCSEEGAHRS